MLHIYRTRVCLELHITAINRRVLQASHDYTVESAFLCVQLSIMVRLLLDGSSYTWCWCHFEICQSHAVQRCSQVLRVGHDLGPVFVQHSLALEVFVPHAHLVHRPNLETNRL